jgi:hypothetical protein
MEYHGNDLNSFVGNDIKLGMIIPTIRSRISVGIEVTTGIRLNVYSSTTYVYSWNAHGSLWASDSR